jgi:hypothetical protein
MNEAPLEITHAHWLGPRTWRRIADQIHHRHEGKQKWFSPI